MRAVSTRVLERPFFRRAAYYFGFGQGTPDDDPGERDSVGSLVSVVLAVVVGVALPNLLGLEGWENFLATVGLIAALSLVFGLIRRQISAGSA